jgi:hypothetical protein
MTAVPVRDSLKGESLYLEPKAFLRGALLNGNPAVVFVLRSEQGEVLASFETGAKNAHMLSEYTRQEAELASVAEEE